MLLGVHFLTSGAIASSLTKSPFIAILIGIIVHHLADRLPHLDTNIFTTKKYFSLKDFNSLEDYKKIGLTIIEFIIFILLFFYLMDGKSLDIQKIAFWGGVGGLIPDLLNFFNIILSNRLASFRIFRNYRDFHEKFHYRGKNRIIALFIQAIFLIFCITLILGLA